MSTLTVAKDDFRNARRSYIVVGVIGLFAGLTALIFLSEMDFYEPYRTLFDVLFFVSFVLPILLAPLAYLSIAGDRESGAIKYAMGLPNSRGEYFAGKFLSRFGVAAAAVLLAVLAGFVISLAAFSPSPDVARFALFAGITLLYAFTFVSLFVAVSASTKSRSRAMFGALGLYFVLIVFWFGFLPLLNMPTLLSAIGDLLGVTITEDTQSYVAVLSPGTAYLQTSKQVFVGVLDQYPGPQDFGQFASGDELYAQTWFTALIMLAWSLGSLAVGYLQFERSELG
jgi:ABC-2 type transport system permease protein